MNSLCDAVLRYFQDGRPLALVTMMDQSGSVPRTAGARMLVRHDGGIWGTVGGGRYEAEAITLATRLLRLAESGGGRGAPRAGAVLEYSLRGVTDMDMICGGALTLLLEVLPPEDDVRAMFALAKEAEEAQLPFVFISRFTRSEGEITDVPGVAPTGVEIEAGQESLADVERFLYLPEEKRLAPSGADIPAEVLRQADSLGSVTPRHCMVRGMEYLLELFPRPFRIIIFGGGHVSGELAKLALGVDFPVIVLDDRPEFANSERFPGAQIQTPPSLNEENSAACLARMRINPRDGIVIVTRGHAHDRDVLAAALETPAGYIGMIGSKSKRAAVYASLAERGVSRERLAFVHSPIGLAIGADTPAEIAVSIAGELIQWRKQTRDREEGRAPAPDSSASAPRRKAGGG